MRLWRPVVWCLQVHSLFQRNVIFALAVIHFKRSRVVTRESGDESVPEWCNGERVWGRRAVWTSRPSFNVRCRRAFFRLWFLILVHEAWSDGCVPCFSTWCVFQFEYVRIDWIYKSVCMRWRWMFYCLVPQISWNKSCFLITSDASYVLIDWNQSWKSLLVAALHLYFKTLLLFIFSDTIRLHYLTNTRIKSDFNWFSHEYILSADTQWELCDSVSVTEVIYAL